MASNIDESMDMELSRQVVRKSKDNDVFWIDLQVNVSGQALWSDGSVVTYRFGCFYCFALLFLIPTVSKTFQIILIVIVIVMVYCDHLRWT